jgi:hypothetical protein
MRHGSTGLVLPVLGLAAVIALSRPAMNNRS